MATVFAITSKIPAADYVKKTGQRGLVYHSLKLLGSATIEQLTDAIRANVKTCQTPERIAAYYVCELKKYGFVSTVDAQNGEENLDTLIALRDMLERKLDEVVAKIEAITVPVEENQQ